MTGFTRRLQGGAGPKVVIGGTTYPSALTTGPVSGTVLDNNGGSGWEPADFYGGADGVIFNGYNIVCTYPMEFPVGDTGKTITFTNCVFNDGGVYWMVLNDTGRVNLIFENCEFAGAGADNPPNDAAVNGMNITMRNCNIHDCGDGVKIGSNVVFEYNWFHDLYVTGGSHNDGIQSLGTAGNGSEGSGARIYQNFFDASNGATCITLSTGSADDMRDILVEDNLFFCDGYAVNGGYQSGVDDINKVSNIIYRDNKIKYGSFTPALTSTDAPVVVSGTTWYDGPSAGQPTN